MAKKTEVTKVMMSRDGKTKRIMRNFNPGVSKPSRKTKMKHIGAVPMRRHKAVKMSRVKKKVPMVSKQKVAMAKA